jgi:hypothetical protein
MLIQDKAPQKVYGKEIAEIRYAILNMTRSKISLMNNLRRPSITISVVNIASDILTERPIRLMREKYGVVKYYEAQ